MYFIINLQALAEKYGNQFPYDMKNYGNLMEYVKFLYRDNWLVKLLPLDQLGGGFLDKIKESFGFDLWRSPDGLHWNPVALDGLAIPHNYGARNLFVTTEDRLYLGTANPFDGCEVWVKDHSC
ncbi:MAG: hypothetical protein Q8898_17710 [Bacillota bacterium]|nr:hypothetical protein [Bacillota bacterium]